MICKKCKEKPVYIKKRQLCKNCYQKWCRTSGGYLRKRGSKKRVIKRFAKKYPGIIKDMKDARQKHFYTIMQLEEKYEISRERIRQIYNLIYPTPQRQARIKLAQKRKDDAPMVCINDPRRKVAEWEEGSLPYIGAIYEKKFLDQCAALGFNVKIPCNTNIDLKINGYLVEVKASTKARKTSKNSKIKYHCYSLSSLQIKKADFFACWHQTEKKFFIIPNNFDYQKKSKHIFISEAKTDHYSSKNTFWEHINAFHLLVIPKDIKKSDKNIFMRKAFTEQQIAV